MIKRLSIKISIILVIIIIIAGYLLNNKNKRLIKKYFFPYTLISEQQQKISQLQQKIFELKSSIYANIELNIKELNSDILIKKNIVNLSNNLWNK